MIWLTADLHLGHEKVIAFENRPFKTLNEMNEVLIEKYNSRVGKRDTAYILGDTIFYNNMDLIGKLNGCKVIIIGNHDVRPNRYKKQKGVVWVGDYKRIRTLYGAIVLCHYPMRTWHGSNKGTLMFHGHSHGKIGIIKNSLDVGVDSNNYEPISLHNAIIKVIINNLKLDK